MADVPAAGAVAAAAFEFDLSDPARAAQWRERVEHLTRTDPDGRDLGTVPEPPVRWITQDQDWAVQTLVGLGLRRRTYGALCVLGELGPLRPYIPSPAFA